MKKIKYILLLLTLLINTAGAVNHNINISGYTYTPDFLIMNQGDSVTIYASPSHPTVQVDRDSWYAGLTTPIDNGWGMQTSTFTFVPTQLDTIYFVCEFHVSLGMKGRIAILQVNDIKNTIQNSGSLLLSPNPVSTKFNLTLTNSDSKDINIQIFDFMGRIVKTANLSEIEALYNAKYEIDASELDNGTYFLLIKSADKIYYEKFMVIK
jgi:plastocyanin